MNNTTNINNAKRRRRFQAASFALYDLAELMRADGQPRAASDVERLADSLGEYVTDAYVGRNRDYA